MLQKKVRFQEKNLKVVHRAHKPIARSLDRKQLKTVITVLSVLGVWLTATYSMIQSVYMDYAIACSSIIMMLLCLNLSAFKNK